MQGNLAGTYRSLGRLDECLRTQGDVYSATLKLNGEESEYALLAANNYASSLIDLQRNAEAKSLMRKTIPVARRVLGEGHRLTLKMRWNYAEALIEAEGATIDDIRETVTTLEDAERIARRVLGGEHPTTTGIEKALRHARVALRARETGTDLATALATLFIDSL